MESRYLTPTVLILVLIAVSLTSALGIIRMGADASLSIETVIAYPDFLRALRSRTVRIRHAVPDQVTPLHALQPDHAGIVAPVWINPAPETNTPDGGHAATARNAAR